MKIRDMAFTFSLLLFSSAGLGLEAYDYTPLDEGGYGSDNDNYYHRDDSYSRNDGGYIRNEERPSRSQPKPTKYSRYARAQSGGVGLGRIFVFDPNQLRWYAFYNGNLINSGPASGGRFYCPDIRRPCKTPVGVFHISHKGGPDCKSSKYPVGKGKAPMPWCMFFRHGYAIHGGSVPPYNVSHGCIHVPSSDARWLNTHFLTPGSKVIVRSYH